MKYSVIGATGQAGRATARALLKANHGVSQRGAELMSDMIDGFNSAWISFEGGSAEAAYGTTSLHDVLGVLAERAA
jgi:hypothetical protein